MVTSTHSIAFNGLSAIDLDVQVHFSPGKPSFNIVGLGDKAISEAKERVRAAISSMGLGFPFERITVNLSPADLTKEGSHYDLPIALAILGEMKLIDPKTLKNLYSLGELSLDGTIQKAPGILPASIHANSKNKGLICSYDAGIEAFFAGDMAHVILAKNLNQLIAHFRGTEIISKPQFDNINIAKKINYPDMADVKGQIAAKRAIEIAAAGGHNLLMCGPPGAGKSMLAKRIPSILPDCSSQEILDISMIASITGNLDEYGSLATARPFRDPHHSCSVASMVGGGKKAKPGEITLAHNGILFLDELPEFPKAVLESLRQPLENDNVTVSRAEAHITYPAKIQLIAAMNPCQCGFLGDKKKECKQAPECSKRYLNRLSGPLLDRIDIHVDVKSVPVSELSFNIDKLPSESSETIKKRVLNARLIQKQRFTNAHENYNINAKMTGKNLNKLANMEDNAKKILLLAHDSYNLSMRSHERIIRVARTIADLENSVKILAKHIKEALNYRPKLFLK